MARTYDSPRHDALRRFLVQQRKNAGLRQVDLAKRLKRRQDYVSYVETGQKLVEVVELMEWAEPSDSMPRMPSRHLPRYGNNQYNNSELHGA
jgi:hypothetical protein